MSLRLSREPFDGWPAEGRAFTLMEMLIAVTACAIILAAVHTVFFGAIRLRNTTDLALTESQPRRHALSIIRRDLANLAAVGGTLTGPLQFTGASVGGRVSPEFYTTTGTLSEGTPWPELQKVSYLLAESTNVWAGKDLVRVITRNVLESSSEQPVYQWLLGGVEQMAFQFYDGSQWQDSWDSTAEEAQTPRGIRVQMRLASTNEQARLLELVVPVLVQSRTNQTEQGESSAL